MKNQINYGFDAPAVMRNLIIIGILFPFIGFLIPYFSQITVLKYISYFISVLGFVSLILGTSMYIYGIEGKFKMRDFVLSKITWNGNENVLDIGTGLGVYMIGAAKHLTTGKAIGIDIWRAEDLSNNNIYNTYRNAELEKVKDKVEIKNEDARKLSFANDSFDVILSMWCIHNIDDKSEQEKACFEIARVLKPNGTALIGEFIPTHDYAKYFEKAGLKVISSKNYISKAYTLMWMVEAKKIY
jgi:ubiquinone/menaquinone biosynthesis C-methylase UbiE